MARLARFVLPGIPHHVIQRGNGRKQKLDPGSGAGVTGEGVARLALRQAQGERGNLPSPSSWPVRPRGAPVAGGIVTLPLRLFFTLRPLRETKKLDPGSRSCGVPGAGD